MRQQLTPGGNVRFGKRSELDLAPSVLLAGEEKSGCVPPGWGLKWGLTRGPSELSRLGAAGLGRVAVNPVHTCRGRQSSGRKNLRNTITEARTLC